MTDREKKQAVYLMVPRKVVIAVVTVSVVLFIGVLASFQYTNYVSRQLCGVVKITNDSYKAHPPPSSTGQQLAKEFTRLVKKYHC